MFTGQRADARAGRSPLPPGLAALRDGSIMRAMQPKKIVLVVDDEPTVVRFVKASLSLAGYEVIGTTRGDEALQLIETKKPDIILLDVLMVPMTGFEVLEKLRTFSRVPVIVFTARHDIGGQAIALGADAFIAKPFKPDALTEKIAEVLHDTGNVTSEPDLPRSS